MKAVTTKVSRPLSPSVVQIALLSLLALAGCRKEPANKAALEAPPAATALVQSGDTEVIQVDGAARFPLTQVTVEPVVSKLNTTCNVVADVSREIPVLSLANGRIVALHVGLGDTVHKGQLIMEVQSADAATAFGTYLKAVSDEHLAEVTLTRDKLLYDKGAIAQSMLEAAQNGEEDAKAGLVASEQQLKILGVDKNHPGDTVRIYAPASGVIISQNATSAGAAGITYAGPQGSLLIADLSHVWVVCDVYENDLASIHLGEHADIRLNAFASQVYSGTISDIGAVLDPSLRTAKVRISVANAGSAIRIGMFATATLLGQHAAPVAAVLQTAVLNLHDRQYVFVPATGKSGAFRRVTIKTGRTLDATHTEVLAGLHGGEQVVVNALDLQNTADQQ